MELLRVFESKKALLQLSVTDSVTDSMLNLPILFHKKEIESHKNMNEIIYCKTDFSSHKTKKSLVKTNISLRNQTSSSTVSWVWAAYVLSYQYMEKVAY